MNDIELYDYFASNNSRFGRPLREEEVNKDLPYFHVYKNDCNRFTLKCYNYKDHDNAPRMEFIEWYLNTNIFPNVKGNICGYYNIELHDSYTYLNNDINYKGCLVFSKFKNDNTPVLIPDPFAMSSWGGLHSNLPVDNIPWDSKKRKGCFFGTTTGNRDPSRNRRIDICLWSLKKRDILDCYITKIAQMSEGSVREYAQEHFDDIMTSHKSPNEQMEYKYNIIIDGNTCRFDIWNYFINSVALKFESEEHLWYYPMLQDKVHYISVKKESIEPIIKNTSSKDAEFIIANAQKVAKKIVNPLTHMQYFTSLFEYMSQNRS